MTSSGARPRPGGRSRPATSSSPPGSAAPRRCWSRAGSIPRAARADRPGTGRRRLPGPDRVPGAGQAHGAAGAGSVRRLVSAGEPLNPEVIGAWSGRPGWRSPTGTARPRPAISRATTSASRSGRDRWAGRSPGSSCGSSTRCSSCGPRAARPSSQLPRRRAVRRRVVVDRRRGRRRRGRLPLVPGPQRRPDRLRRLPDRTVRGRVGAAHPPGGRRGGRGRRPRPGTGLDRPGDRRRP